LKRIVLPNPTKQRPKKQFQKTRKEAIVWATMQKEKSATNVVRTSNGRRFHETTSVVRMVDVRGNDEMLHSMKMKGDVTIVSVMKRGIATTVGVRKTDGAPITTEGCAATKNKRLH
jgi:hypothetical protein